jgi:hypothetical protein
MLASNPASILNQNSRDLGIPNRFNPAESDSSAKGVRGRSGRAADRSFASSCRRGVANLFGPAELTHGNHGEKLRGIALAGHRPPNHRPSPNRHRPPYWSTSVRTVVAHTRNGAETSCERAGTRSVTGCRGGQLAEALTKVVERGRRRLDQRDPVAGRVDAAAVSSTANGPPAQQRKIRGRSIMDLRVDELPRAAAEALVDAVISICLAARAPSSCAQEQAVRAFSI